MANPDFELLRLERAVEQARFRLGWITRLMFDPGLLQAAEDQCAITTAARDAYLAMHEPPERK
jgi:hypothetical protein